MTYFLLGLIALGLVLMLINWLTKAAPRDVLKALKWIGLGLVGVVILLVILTRNIHLIWAIAAGAIPWLMRLQSLRQIWKSMRGPAKGQASQISSRFVDMQLDHDSGEMDGRIKEGEFAGALLSELSMAEGQAFISEITAAGDDRSLRLVEAYLDRQHGAAWRSDEQRAGGPDDGEKASQPPPRNGAMTRQEALDLLGLKQNASAEDIKEAHRRIIKQVHPDIGGSAYLAARVNQAKDFLLKSG